MTLAGASLQLTGVRFICSFKNRTNHRIREGGGRGQGTEKKKTDRKKGGIRGGCVVGGNRGDIDKTSPAILTLYFWQTSRTHIYGSHLPRLPPCSQAQWYGPQLRSTCCVGRINLLFMWKWVFSLCSARIPTAGALALPAPSLPQPMTLKVSTDSSETRSGEVWRALPLPAFATGCAPHPSYLTHTTPSPLLTHCTARIALLLSLCPVWTDVRRYSFSHVPTC
ncbi:hypothetical protein MHYP_G00008860 [Metynnis hypsauchen]